jgi:hypothetical protein
LSTAATHGQPSLIYHENKSGDSVAGAGPPIDLRRMVEAVPDFSLSDMGDVLLGKRSTEHFVSMENCVGAALTPSTLVAFDFKELASITILPVIAPVQLVRSHHSAADRAAARVRGSNVPISREFWDDYFLDARTFSAVVTRWPVALL